MGVSWKLATNYIKNNRKKTVIIASCIIISTILITTILLLIDSYREYMISSERSKGNWEIAYKDINYEEAEIIENDKNIKEISVMSHIGEVKEKDSIRPLSIIGYDLNALNNLIKNNLTDGRMPENSSEIIGQDSKFKIGDKFTSNKDGVKKDYIIVGTIKFSEFVDSFQLITLLDRNTLKKNDKVDITVLNNDIKDLYNNYYDIYYKLSSYRSEDSYSLDEMTEYNITLLEYAGLTNYVSGFQKDIYIIEGVLIGIVLICSMIYIYSVINVSIIDRKKYFGILESVGATTKQIKRSVRMEIFIILIITIPLGIIIGICLDYILLNVINKIIPETVVSFNSVFLNFMNYNEKIKIAIPISTVGLSTVIIIITVYMASFHPINKISKLQPINLIKMNKDIKTKKKKLFINNIEGLLAIKNIERYKTRYRTVIISLAISIILIIISNYYISNVMANAYDSDFNYEIYVNYNKDKDGDLTEKIIDEIENEKIADRIVSIKDNYICTMLIESNNISSEEKEFSRKMFDGSNYLYGHFTALNSSKENSDIYQMQISVLTLNNDAYRNYLKEIGVDKLEDNECILVDYLDEKTKYYDGIRITNFKDGDKIILKLGMMTNQFIEDINENKAELIIKKVAKQIPKGLKGIQNAPMVIGNENVIKNLNLQMFGNEFIDNTSNENDLILLRVNNIEKTNQTIKEISQKYSTNSNFSNSNNIIDIYGQENTSQEMMEKENLLRKIFIYGFIVIVTLSGIINIYNSINIFLKERKNEVIQLILVGMENKQINKMIFIENLICGVLTLLIGIAWGILISYIIYFINIDYIWYAFSIPWKSILVILVSSVLIIILSTVYFKKKLLKSDLIRIIKENSI